MTDKIISCPRQQFVKKREPVSVVQLKGSGSYHSERGHIMTFEEGDFLVESLCGDQWIISAEYLNRNYEPWID
ncbi:hypothetical protein [Reinekea sp.]|jgi:hypothetical protein|uniref:hypothetical protein n=1 Tax=Reinekea sp. TaxID=1970455 RepID=UPI00398921AA